MKYKVPFIKPSFPRPDEVALDVAEIISSNWYTNFGPFERSLRNSVISYLKPVHKIDVCTTSSATAALEVAIKCLFGDAAKANHVIMPSFTFAAGCNVVVSCGFSPVFVDIDSNWQPDIQQAKEYLELNSKTVAGILLCNTYGVGNPVINEWEILAKQYDVALIIDSAAGFGSIYSEHERLGSRGDCEIFSMHATKPFSVGEGGLIVSRSTRTISKCRELTNFGFNGERIVTAIGINAKLNEISSAIGIRQLNNLDNRLEGRRKSLRFYKGHLEKLGYRFQPNDENSTVAFVAALAPDKGVADATLKALTENGIEAKQYYTPLSEQPLFRGYEKLDLIVTKEVAERVVCLPLHDHMAEETILRIAKVIKDVLKNEKNT